MKLALVHDYLSQEGGAERVLREMHALWPDAPVFVLFHDRDRAHPAFRDWAVRTSWLQTLPGATERYRWYLPLMPAATESHDLREFDVILSSSSAFAKGVIVHPEAIHISYCHTPTRFLWTDSNSYVEELQYPRVVKQLLPPVLNYLRIWDRQAAERVDRFVANSETVRRRIQKYYGRDADVIHPPVDVVSRETNPLTPPYTKGEIRVHPPYDKGDRRGLSNYYLVGGRLVAYKRFDLVVRAFSKLGVPLVVFGEGPEFERLRAIAKPNIEFVGRVSDDEKRALYAGCIAFIHPHVEDFGITAIEAMAAGRPVIAYPAGGALETVLPGITGDFLEDQSWENLAHHIIRFDPARFDAARIRDHAARYDASVFRDKLRAYVARAYEERETVRRRGQLTIPVMSS